MFPACSADHNCCGVADTFFACSTCPEEECAFEASGAGNTAAWLAPSGCSAFPGCGAADGDAVPLIGAVENPCADEGQDRKSTRLNSSHRTISYAVFCLKKKKNRNNE